MAQRPPMTKSSTEGASSSGPGDSALPWPPSESCFYLVSPRRAPHKSIGCMYVELCSRESRFLTTVRGRLHALAAMLAAGTLVRLMVWVIAITACRTTVAQVTTHVMRISQTSLWSAAR